MIGRKEKSERVIMKVHNFLAVSAMQRPKHSTDKESQGENDGDESGNGNLGPTTEGNWTLLPLNRSEVCSSQKLLIRPRELTVWKTRPQR